MRVDAESLADEPTGTSWESAYSSLIEALAEAADRVATDESSYCEVWIAAGNYHLEETGAMFDLATGVHVYGGFHGDEESRGDWSSEHLQSATHPRRTILSGDLGSDQHAHTVVRASDATDVRLAGVVIADGEYASTCSVSHPIGGACRGAGMYISNAEVMLEGVWFQENEAPLGGAMAIVGDSQVEFSSGRITRNLGRLGAGISVDTDATAVIDSVDFEQNESTMMGIPGAKGGAIYLGEGASITISHSDLTSNTTQQEGGAIWLGPQSELVGEELSFEGNSAGESGGAIYSSDATLLLVDTEFRSNEAHTNLEQHGGGAIRAVGDGETTLRRVRFFENHSERSGGALEVLATDEKAALTLENCEFRGNTANTRGGAVRVVHIDPLLVVNGLFFENVADTSGSAFHLTNSDGHIWNATFASNTGGAAIQAVTSSLNLFNTLFFGNTDDVGGQSLTEHDSSRPTVDPFEELSSGDLRLREGSSPSTLAEKIRTSRSSPEDPMTPWISTARPGFRGPRSMPAPTSGEPGPGPQES